MHFITFLLKNLLRRKARTLLTILGIAVAVGTTISLLGVSDNFERETMHGLAGRGIDIVVLEKDVLDQLTSDLLENTGGEITANIPEVDATAVALIEIVAYKQEGTTLTLIFQGWNTDSFLLDGLTILEGRKLQEGDANQVILGKIVADLIKKKPGDKMLVEGEEFEVVGIFESFTLQENRCLVANLPKMQDMYFREGHVTGLSVRLKNKNATKVEVQEICDKINKLTKITHQGDSELEVGTVVSKEHFEELNKQLESEGKEPCKGDLLKLDAQPTSEYVNNSLHIRVAQSMAWMTSIIAVFVGAIGMLNTMVMSVVERVKEISILRAIGWKKIRIVKMIVGESVLLSIAGTIFGAIGSVVLIRLLVSLPQVSGYLNSSIPWTAFAKGIGLALIIGFVGGLYPAIRAAALMPSEGLRHE